MRRLILFCYAALLAIVMISVGAAAVIIMDQIEDDETANENRGLESEEEDYVPFQSGGSAAY